GSDTHVRPSLHIVSVGHSPRQTLSDETHALERNAVCHRVIALRAKCFEAMHVGVHAGKRSEMRRQTYRQERICHHNGWLHLRMKNQLLFAPLIDHERCTTHFGSSTSRCRNGYHGRDLRTVGPLVVVADVFIIKQCAWVIRQESHTFSS